MLKWLFRRAKRPVESPIGEQEQRWIEKTSSFVFSHFLRDDPLINGIYIPEPAKIPLVHADLTEANIHGVFRFIANSMRVDPDKINLVLREDKKLHVASSPFGGALYLETGNVTAGTYAEDSGVLGEHTVTLNVFPSDSMPRIIATLAHELAHYKLMSQSGFLTDCEYTTDLLPVFYGYGLFLGNHACNYLVNIDSQRLRYEYEASGYMTQAMFAYAMAVHAFFLQSETKHLLQYMRADLRHAFKASLDYLVESNRLFTMRAYYSGERNE